MAAQSLFLFLCMFRNGTLKEDIEFIPGEEGASLI